MSLKQKVFCYRTIGILLQNNRYFVMNRTIGILLQNKSKLKNIGQPQPNFGIPKKVCIILQKIKHNEYLSSKSPNNVSTDRTNGHLRNKRNFI